jgi:Uma2 family endonuclease
MTQAKPRCSTFEEYLSYDDGTDNRYQLIDEELVELPAELEPNDYIANYLFLIFANAGISPRLIRPHTCEIQVPVLKKGDAQNRYPDLVVLQDVHLQLTQRRLTITLDMPPPVLVVEVVSPGPTNRRRDLIAKRDQYCQRGILEYWVIDPEEQSVLVLKLVDDQYVEIGTFKGSDRILSHQFPSIALTPDQLFAAIQ